MARPNKPWYLTPKGIWVIKLDGRQRTLAKGPKAETRAAAFAEFHALMARKQAEQAPPSEMLLATLTDLFLAEVERDRAPLTFESYRQRLGSFRRKYGAARAVEIRPMHVARWLAEHRWSDSTRHGAITAAKRLFSWAKAQGYLEVDPLAGLPKPAMGARETDLTTGQADAIRDAVGPGPFGDLLAVLRATGMRPSEAMSLTAAMLDVEGGTAHPTGKGRKRVVYLNVQTCDLLRELAARHPEGPILRNADGRPWTRHATAQRFARLRERMSWLRERRGVGAEATAESYRHAFVTDALEGDVADATIAELVGHKGTAMISRHYSKLRERKGHLREALQKIRPDED